MTERVQEWPEEDLEHLRSPDEQITTNNLGLLPSLWQMVHYDPAPPDLSNSKKTSSCHDMTTTGNQDASTFSAAAQQQLHRNQVNGYAPVSSGGGSYATFHMPALNMLPNYAARFPTAHAPVGSASTGELSVPHGGKH